MLEKLFDWFIAIQSTYWYGVYQYVYYFALLCYTIFCGYRLGKHGWPDIFWGAFCAMAGALLGGLFSELREFYLDNYYWPLKDQKANFPDLNVPDNVPSNVEPQVEEDPLSEEEKLKQEKRKVLLKSFILFTIYFALIGGFSNIPK